MCGIVGIVSKNKIEKSEIEKMNDEIFHRGPDSAGFFVEDKIALAMRRLKIIDISGGDQPIYNENGNIIVFFNGEIYNFKNVREELFRGGHIFGTKSDTEVLVHGYEEWGIDGLLEKIEGMFVFAIYDKRKNKIFIARDRFGEKPLYYHTDGKKFIFSSELRAILVDKNTPKEIEPESLYKFLALHFVPEEKTILKDIVRLKAGHYLVLDIETLEFNMKKYWKLNERIIKDSFSQAKKNIRMYIEKSIRDRMVADVPVGAFLSGGIDSSIMVGIMSKHTKNLKTFSIGFENPKFDESNFSKAVAKHYKTDHHHFVFTEKDVVNMLPEVVKYMDEPIGDQALLPVLLLSREAKKYVTVVLGGEGADEVFGGYEYYAPFVKNDNLKDIIKSLFSNKKSFLNEILCQTTSGFPLITNKFDRLILMGKNAREDEIDFEKSINEKGFIKDSQSIKDRMKKAQHSDIYSWLVDDLLIKYDRMGMAASLEGRAPYLDSKLVEYGYNLPKKYKWKGGVSKYILREACVDLLPKEIFSRKKQGFNLPMSEWLRGILKEKLIESSDFIQNDLINNNYYKILIDNHLSGKEDRGRLLYSILVYRLWYKNLK
ncbi:MAG: asparagine synthase (glutamine-hydrolyzing) [Candidatus Moraniibacteriota bacterium]